MTSGNALSKYTVSGVADVLGCFGVPTSTAMQLYNDILGERAQGALEMLLSEVRQGRFEGVDQHEAVGVIARFQRDAMEGVAKNNLRLMARIINGMAEQQALMAPTFLRYANILASLTDDEISMLAIVAKHKESFSSDFIEKAPKNFEAILQALLRTGLVEMEFSTGIGESLSKWSNEPNVTTEAHFSGTDLLDEILQYCPDLEGEQ